MTRLFAAAIAALSIAAGSAGAAGSAFVFASIDGGSLDMDDWKGRPVLVANTASFCAFTPQYEELQALYDRYRDRGLVVLAVPSDDFHQEYGTEAEVKDFCTNTFGLDLPMTEITHVRGSRAHPFFKWVAETKGFVPSWNFNKILIGPDGQVEGTWGSMTKPMSRPITAAVEAALAE